MSIDRRIERVFHIAGPPGPVQAVSISERDRKLITVCQDARDLLAGSQRHGDLGFRSFGIQHPHFEVKTLVTRCDPGKIASGRVAGCAPARTVEVLLARVGTSGLQIGDIHSLASALLRECYVALGVNEGGQAGNLLARNIKMRHAFLRAPAAHNRADLVSIHIGGHELGTGEIRPGFSAVRIAAVAKRAIFPEERAPALDQSRRV